MAIKKIKEMMHGFLVSNEWKQDIPELVTKEKEFNELFNEVKNHSFMGVNRLFFLYQFAKHALTLSGEVAEIGVYKGGSAKLIAKVFQNTPKKIHLFDTFTGFPTGHPKNENNKEMFKGETDLSSVQNYLKECNNVVLHQGLFPNTAKELKQKKFCFVHIDADLYKSTLDCLEFFYPKMVFGGIIVCADYTASKYKGPGKAINEFLKDKKEFPIHTTENQCIIIKK